MQAVNRLLTTDCPSLVIGFVLPKAQNQKKINVQ